MEDFRGTIYDFADTSKMRGAWKLMMVIAAKADGSCQFEKKVVCGQIRTFQHYFKCENCKKHFGEYLESHPPEDVKNDTDGLFKWVVKFMNSVAVRKGKETYSYDILYKLFHISAFGLCTETKKNTTNDSSNINVPGFKELKPKSSTSTLGYSYTPENSRIKHTPISEVIK